MEPTPPANPSPTPPPAPLPRLPGDEGITGLGGWLVLVGIGIVVTPIRILLTLLPMYKKMWDDGTWEALTTPGTMAYDPLWEPLLLTEITVNAALVVNAFFLFHLFIGRKRLLPPWFIGTMVFGPVFIAVDALAISMVTPAGVEAFSAEVQGELVKSLVGACVWVPYMLRSRRVKLTFTR